MSEPQNSGSLIIDIIKTLIDNQSHSPPISAS